MTCHDCGGRGETWTEQCGRCNGSGSRAAASPVAGRGAGRSLRRRPLQLHASLPATTRPRVSSSASLWPTLLGTQWTGTSRFSASWRVSGEHWQRWWACRCCCSQPVRSPCGRPGAETVSFAAGLTAAVFASIGAFSLIWGIAHIWAAALLRRRAPRPRLMLGLAVVNLLVFPFGTALGAYALWMLLTQRRTSVVRAVVGRSAGGGHGDKIDRIPMAAIPLNRCWRAQGRDRSRLAARYRLARTSSRT